MRLNLGCGGDIRSGYVNVDFRELPGVDLVVDLSTFPWPFEDDSADEILMLDFLEHFPYRSTPFILLECYRILKPEGTVVIQVPDALHTMRALAQEGDYLCNRCGGGMDEGRRTRCEKCGQHIDEVSEAAVQRFYGGQDFPGNFHQTCFSARSLTLKASLAGLEFVPYPSDFNYEHYWRNWTLHMTFRKGELW